MGLHFDELEPAIPVTFAILAYSPYGPSRNSYSPYGAYYSNPYSSYGNYYNNYYRNYYGKR